jgi:putative membrane protein
MALLDDADRQRIEAAIGALEQRTQAEVVVAIVKRSTHAWLPRAVVAFAAALSAGLGFLEGLPNVDGRFSLFVELVVGFAVFALCGLPPVERLLVSRAEARREVEERAFALFARHGIYRTRAHTGVLLLVSELERHVVILGDRAIHGRLGQAGWQSHIDHLLLAIRRGEAARGILDVLERLAGVLAELAPAGEQNDDELPNAVIEEP